MGLLVGPYERGGGNKTYLVRFLSVEKGVVTTVSHSPNNELTYGRVWERSVQIELIDL